MNAASLENTSERRRLCPLLFVDCLGAELSGCATCLCPLLLAGVNVSNPPRSGGHFSSHIDGPWVPHEDESSVFTVIIYLNSNFQGGATDFLNEDKTGNQNCLNQR